MAPGTEGMSPSAPPVPLEAALASDFPGGPYGPRQVLAEVQAGQLATGKDVVEGVAAVPASPAQATTGSPAPPVG